MSGFFLGHFLFLKVRENADGNEAFIYSPFFITTLSSQDCQVNILIGLLIYLKGSLLRRRIESIRLFKPATKTAFHCFISFTNSSKP